MTPSTARPGSSTSSRPRARSTAVADWRLAVDIGGTFTDVVLLDADSGRVVVDKTLTTPANPLEGVQRGV
ncbi:MAG TPA: hydantoinase/oxoprolinase N-terminal domain-containing protein, partial [Acidimicrobiales bacterium]|nr:hydantoinase/oxoprolinase N-terminal domain-containing protein [Acidimicrobiales bacterium]